MVNISASKAEDVRFNSGYRDVKGLTKKDYLVKTQTDNLIIGGSSPSTYYINMSSYPF